MKTYIDQRYEGAGFVVVQNGKRETRMIWCINSDNQIEVSVGNWGTMSSAEQSAALAKLRSVYPTHIFITL